MKNISTHHGKLEHIERLASSINGNPRFRAYCGGVNFKTPVDSSLGYALRNFEGKDVIITVGSHYGVCTLDSIKLA